MKRYPGLTINDVAQMTVYQQASMADPDAGDGIVHFDNLEEFMKWHQERK